MQLSRLFEIIWRKTQILEREKRKRMTQTKNGSEQYLKSREKNAFESQKNVENLKYSS